MLNSINPEFAGKFFEIRLTSLANGRPLPVDIYILIDDMPKLFRQRGDTLSAQGMESLSAQGANEVLVLENQRPFLSNYLSEVLRDPKANTQVKGTILKQSALMQMKSLFGKKDVKPIIQESGVLIHEIVGFLSSDARAVGTLISFSENDEAVFTHSVHTSVYAVALAKQLYGNDVKKLMAAGLAGMIHDIGKKNLPKKIVMELGPLSPQERELEMSHPLLGEEIIRAVSNIPKEVKEVVVQHHENIDGSGYPKGLKGDQISELTRIVAVADAFDSLTSHRKNQPRLDAHAALDTMAKSKRFDPKIFKYLKPNTKMTA